jgi:putative DNA primase/helicase
MAAVNTRKTGSSKAYPSAQNIAEQFGRASQVGPVTWKCDCPTCGYPCLSVFIDDDGEIGFLCYSCNSPKAIREQAAARGFVPSPQDSKVIAAQMVAEGLAMWAGGVPISETEAATYLIKRRGLSPPWPDKVRAECDRLPYHEGSLFYATRLLCLVEHPARGVLGVHAIGLNDGGRMKGYSHHRKKRGSSVYRRYGLLEGGGCWLGETGGEIVVGEGVETTLSAMTLLERTWGVAALGALGLKRLDLPDAAERVCIAADNDADGAGQEAAQYALERWEEDGRDVRVVIPNKPGSDFNDVLRGRTK